MAILTRMSASECSEGFVLALLDFIFFLFCKLWTRYRVLQTGILLSALLLYYNYRLFFASHCVLDAFAMSASIIAQEFGGVIFLACHTAISHGCEATLASTFISNRDTLFE